MPEMLDTPGRLPGGVIREFTGVRVTDELRIELAAADNSELPPLLNGIEIVAES